MRCTFCLEGETRVVETRESKSGMRRRRECESCGERFTTYERVQTQVVRVIKKDGSREILNMDKIRKGLVLACEKRPVTKQQLLDAAKTIERQIRKLGEPEIHSSLIGDLTMEQLRLLDEVAYIRFASVYKSFTDVESFQQEIQVLTQGD